MSKLAEANTNVMPGENTVKIRRIVTGHDAEGKAIILEDEICPNRFAMGGNPNFVDTEIWHLDDVSGDNSADYKDPATQFGFVPPLKGNICRFLEIPPDSTLGTDDGEEVKPLFHRTASLDYAVVISGEILAVMDGAEMVMKAGDIMVQRGTIHAWSNKTDKPCLMLFVLCGTDPIPGLEVL